MHGLAGPRATSNGQGTACRSARVTPRADGSVGFPLQERNPHRFVRDGIVAHALDGEPTNNISWLSKRVKSHLNIILETYVQNSTDIDDRALVVPLILASVSVARSLCGGQSLYRGMEYSPPENSARFTQ